MSTATAYVTRSTGTLREIAFAVSTSRAAELVTHWLTLVSSHGNHPGHGIF